MGEMWGEEIRGVKCGMKRPGGEMWGEETRW